MNKFFITKKPAKPIKSAQICQRDHTGPFFFFFFAIHEWFCISKQNTMVKLDLGVTSVTFMYFSFKIIWYWCDNQINSIKFNGMLKLNSIVQWVVNVDVTIYWYDDI